MKSHLLVILSCSLLSWYPWEVVAQQAAAAAYAPKFSPCPRGTSLLRSAGTGVGKSKQRLSSAEAEYVAKRQALVIPEAWRAYLSNVESVARHNNIVIPHYLSSILSSSAEERPNLGIATSGGGYRAAIFGGGVLSVLDGRNQTSVSQGTGGLLQAATYLSGLSGGSWLVSSLAQSDFPLIPEVIFGTSPAFTGWNTEISFVQPSANLTLTEEFLIGLAEETAGKVEAGFPVSVADLWARAISRHFVNGTTLSNFFDTNLTHGAGETFSSIVDRSSFQRHAQPFPIVISDSIVSNPNKSAIFNEPTIMVPLTSPIYEFNPFEFGSWDPSLGTFTPTKFIGSPNNSLCVTGFDQTSFVAGVSSMIFNEFNTSQIGLLNSTAGPLFEILNLTIPQPGIELDAGLVPNPFFGIANTTFVDSNEKFLRLVDGGEDGETTPFQPLLVKARNVDTIFAIDAPADLPDAFAAGFSVLATSQRASLFPETYSFPPVPSSIDVFSSQNLTKHPTFFGCDSSTTAPLVIYLANGGPPLGQVPLTNTTTAQDVYPPEEIQAMLNQIFDVATQGIPVNGTKDPEWPICLACAVVDRARARSGVRRSGVCSTCLSRYCWS
ncbi:lysophospholipase [Abortiporus biennis]|nr:lysophospholipase [Abortiporus biennis]